MAGLVIVTWLAFVILGVGAVFVFATTLWEHHRHEGSEE